VKSGDLPSLESQAQKGLLRRIPPVDRILDHPPVQGLLKEFNRNLVAEKLRGILDRIRTEILASTLTSPSRLDPKIIVAELIQELASWKRIRPIRVVNASGVVIHSNLGRAVLSDQAVETIRVAASGPTALEFDLQTGKRGKREMTVLDDLVRLTGAETATVVNNNAAAVFLILNTLAQGKEVIVSRGELMEIGDSFRIPEIMEKSGAVLREVGTTNRTHIGDYERAINDRTAILLKVHPSNYKITGFACEVSLQDLVRLGSQRGIPVAEDLGSGAIVDLARFGLPREPVVSERLSAGASLVSFSGDKLMGGPQAGIIAGKEFLIERINANPLKRVLRVDKLTLAALAGTLRVYLGSSDLSSGLPTLRWLVRPVEEMEEVGRAAIPLLRERLGEDFSVSLEESTSQIGSGALPGMELPTRVLAVSHPSQSAEEIGRRFRSSVVPIIGRVEAERFLLDLRGIFDPQEIVPYSEP
jgi:L-seryl-tRNA(Ser) seleniumtransferase